MTCGTELLDVWQSVYHSHKTNPCLTVCDLFMFMTPSRLSLPVIGHHLPELRNTIFKCKTGDTGYWQYEARKQRHLRVDHILTKCYTFL